MTRVKRFVFSPYQTNCFVCYSAGEAVIVDPSCQTVQEQQEIIAFVARQALTIRHLLLTHTHIDHIFGCAALARHYGLDWQLHLEAIGMLAHAREQAHFMGIAVEEPPKPTRFLREGDTVTFGEATWEVLHTPGHAPGSICFHDATSNFVLVGDVLFMDSIGRTDLPGGSLPVLMESIFQKILPLGDNTTMFPGHGPRSTLGRERMQNPFLSDSFTRG